jgi:hypothetical protein
MMAAGYSDNPMACKVLLDEGADPSIKNFKNLNAFYSTTFFLTNISINTNN